MRDGFADDLRPLAQIVQRSRVPSEQVHVPHHHIGIQIRACGWKETKIRDTQLALRDGRVVKSDEDWVEAMGNIKKSLLALRRKRVR